MLHQGTSNEYQQRMFHAEELEEEGQDGPVFHLSTRQVWPFLSEDFKSVGLSVIEK